MAFETDAKDLQHNLAVRSFQNGLVYDLESKSRRRFRVCLRCQKPMTNKNRCDKCKTKFHDGILLSWLKKFLGINPK